MRGRVQEPSGLYVLAAALVLLIFGLDCISPFGLEVWILYVAPVILCVPGVRPGAPLLAGLVAGFLVGVGHFVAPRPEAALAALAPLNRSLVALVLCMLGFAGRRVVTTRLRLLQEDWIKRGHGQLSAVVRGEQGLEELGRNLLAQLARFLGAQVGAAYVLTDAGLRPCGTYARHEGPLREAAAFPPEGSLTGQVLQDGSMLVVDDVPADYVQIRSALGASQVRSLVLLPTQAEGTVNGVVELGFFTHPSPAALDFLERSADVIGISLRSAKYRERQANLLEETQRQAEELLEQQQELRAANEELEEQRQALEASQTYLEEHQSQLESTNAALREQTEALAEQKEQLLATQEILQHKAAALEQASRYKSEFLANMSHELRTPLNSALILAKLLAENEQGNLSAEQVRYASSIYAAGNDLLALINDILDLAKIEAGRMDLAIERVSIPRLFDTLSQRFEPLTRNKGLAFTSHIEAGCPRVIESDFLRLQQVLSNLLSNAVKFTEGGRVSLTAAAQDRGIVFIVEDTGIGIPADQHKAIFEAFHQADGTTSRRFGGTGLGLSISRELAALLGGELGVESAPREGSRFSLSLPLDAVEPAMPARLAVVGEPPARGEAKPSAAAGPPVEDDRGELAPGARVVLAIEDDRIFASILRELAHEQKFQCIIATTADEGLRLAETHQPVAIVLDIGLPDHSGLSVLETLKRNPATRHIPVHVVSVHDYERVAREMGVIGYALKPIKRDELREAFQRLERHLDRTMRSLLVVEDDEVQRDAIRGLLQGEGVEVTAVATADEAYDWLRSQTFDCMVLDLMLPGTSGFDLLERMGEGGASFPPVIVYTARALSPAEEQRLRQHANSIIIKGARSPERLLEEVSLFLHQVEAKLPPEKRRMLQVARSREAVFEGRRILLVEDDVRNIFALTSALEPKGAHIEIARNGKEALARLREPPAIDLVLMDVMMPEMDGLSATREIRKDPRWAELPVIALTAKAMPDDRQRCLEAGASDYVAKPIDLDKLLSMVRVWMPR